MNTNKVNGPAQAVQTSEPEAKKLHKGKRGDYRLFKRDDAGRPVKSHILQDGGWIPNPELPRDRPWHTVIIYKKKRYPRCLDTTVATDAQAKAKALARQIKEAVISSDNKALLQTKMRQESVGTINDLLDRYETSIVTANEDTRGQNRNAVLLIVARVLHGADTPENRQRVLSMPLTVLNGGLVKSWFSLAKKAAEAAGNPETQVSLKTTANSRMGQARSLFTAKAIAEYKDTQDGQRPALWHDCLAEFHAAFNSFKFDGVTTEREYYPPSDEIVSATIAAWEKLENRNLFLAAGHELSFGLRKGELAQAKWNWWSIRSGYPVIDGSAFVKNKTGLISVRALDPFFNHMRAVVDARGWRGNPDDYIITGPDSYREDSISREVGHWLRSLGWETRMTNHALRAYGGSQIAMKYGIHEAQTWLRHSTVKVTEDHYTHFVNKFKPADPDGLLARWAVAAQSFQPRVVSAAG